jgi:hypothetical protein
MYRNTGRLRYFVHVVKYIEILTVVQYIVNDQC